MVEMEVDIMSNEEMRMNMIKLFAIGVKYANAGISDNDFYYRDLIGEIFDDKNGNPASIEDIFERLSNFEDVNHIEERKKLRGYISKIRNNNETIELLKSRMNDLEVIE